MRRNQKKGLAGPFFFFRAAAGFTMAELVAVLVIAGVIAIVVLPRFAGSEFRDAQLYNQTAAALRFAQKSALAMQRTVCVAFTANTITLSYDPNYGTAACASALTAPAGGAYVVNAPAGAALAAVNFSYDRTGRPSTGQTITVSGARQMFVETESGYVRTQ
jgi:MSHA pilin protein MshC